MKKILFLKMFIVLFLTGYILMQCKKSDVVIVPDPFALKLANSSTLGSYLTDKAGNALYSFANDANGVNNCTAGCTANWPIFSFSGLTQENLVTGLLLADFDSITTPSGKQLTYKGWPLYYYAPGGAREASGKTTGDGIGGLWFVAKPDYTIMLANLQLVGNDLKNYVVSAANVYSEGLGATTYFTDAMGRTLYSFYKDSLNINKFTNATFSNNVSWPVYETDVAVVPSVLDKTLFSSITVVGHKQLTYKGWPMFYFGGDVDATTGKYRGKNKGVFGPLPVKWPVFFKDYPAAPHP